MFNDRLYVDVCPDHLLCRAGEARRKSNRLLPFSEYRASITSYRILSSISRDFQLHAACERWIAANKQQFWRGSIAQNTYFLGKEKKRKIGKSKRLKNQSIKISYWEILFFLFFFFVILKCNREIVPGRPQISCNTHKLLFDLRPSAICMEHEDIYGYAWFQFTTWIVEWKKNRSCRSTVAICIDIHREVRCQGNFNFRTCR